MENSNTRCHLGNGNISGIACPMGNGFEVRKLQTNGGHLLCQNPQCPHQVKQTTKQVHRILVIGEHVIPPPAK